MGLTIKLSRTEQSEFWLVFNNRREGYIWAREGKSHEWEILYEGLVDAAERDWERRVLYSAQPIQAILDQADLDSEYRLWLVGLLVHITKIYRVGELRQTQGEKITIVV